MGTHGERLIGLSLKAANFSPVENLAGDAIFCGCGSTAECGRAKAETTVRLRSPAPFLSLWCSPDNMPASHAGDHRSEAGQGHQISFAIYELRFAILVAVRKHLGA